jgi:hypothetical protein
MAKAKTGSFWLTEVITLPGITATGGRVQGTLDLGAYVDVGDQQAISIEEIDFIWQVGTDYGTNVQNMLAGNGALSAQVTDLNPGSVFVRADDHSLIGSGSLNIDQANSVATSAADFYPDSYGKLDESRMVVNDQLYIVAGVDAAGSTTGASAVYVTCRIKARIVKLGTKDWMAIAIQSTAADN